MTHTPGPWRQNAHYWVRQQSGLAICELFGTIEQSRANGALIAAAPDMLAALKAALGAIEPVRTFADVIAEVKAAIAKAEGGHE